MFSSFKLVLEFEMRSLLAHKATWIRIIIVEPLTYLLLLGAGLRGLSSMVLYDGSHEVDYLNFVFPGILGMQLLRIFMHSIYRLTVDRRWGLQALKMSSGVSATAYLLGMQVVPLGLFYAQSLVCYPVALLMGTHASLANLCALVLVSVVGSIFWTSLAVVVTFFIRNYSQRDMILAFVILPLTFSAPVFYDLSQAPAYLRVLSHFNPLTYQVESMRAAYLTGAIGLQFLFSLAASVLLLVLARSVIARAEYLPTDR